MLVFMILPSTPGYNRHGPAHGGAFGQQRVRYFGLNRAEALRQFAEDAQRAAAAGYQPVWQDWSRYGAGELLEVVYEPRAADPPWHVPPPPVAT